MEDHNNTESEPEPEIINNITNETEIINNITNETEIINNITTETIEPIILPLPISISQLMSGMVLGADLGTGIGIGAGANIGIGAGANIGPSFININHSNNLEERIQHQSFHERNRYKKVCDTEFINSLSVQKTTPEMVEQNITCGICLEALKLGEDIIELPCQDKHYFHIKHEGCPGIYPWLKENHTCPMCRHEFPSVEKELEGSDSTLSESTPRSIRRLRPINLMNIINSAIEEQEDRMLQEAIYQSMNPTTQEDNGSEDEML